MNTSMGLYNIVNKKMIGKRIEYSWKELFCANATKEQTSTVQDQYNPIHRKRAICFLLLLNVVVSALYFQVVVNSVPWYDGKNNTVCPWD